MAKKSAIITFKTTPEFKDSLEQTAYNLGFKKGGKKPNNSDFIRWMLEKSHLVLPLCRKKYKHLFEINQNLIRLGGLFNQTIHNINRERYILNDKGYHDENNKLLLKSLDSIQAQNTSLKNELDEMKKVMQKIVNIEGA